MIFIIAISYIHSQADFSGLNGAKDLRLSSFLQINTFSNKKNQVLKRLQFVSKTEDKTLTGEGEEADMGGEEGKGGEGYELPQTEEPADQNLQTPL